MDFGDLDTDCAQKLKPRWAHRGVERPPMWDLLSLVLCYLQLEARSTSGISY